ncbi:hypothetical protein K440DRAFT_544459 [Wilcoxina mikolae CBS 423.85]|nr:hypothetical protein K440DRAFT_544459 [Wilcoxina mikolae CBS 423.85]
MLIGFSSVIAVTGLAGHAYGSLKNRETNRMWLMEFLPQDIKNVRIITYGYDTNLSRRSRPGTKRLVDHQLDCIGKLNTARTTAADRPIIFVGHSLGGILILRVRKLLSIP